MRRWLAVLVGALAIVACASSRKESQEAPATVAASTTPQAIATDLAGPADGAREQANAGLASARARLQEAQRELEAARPAWTAADTESRSAQAQMESASKVTDSVAQARAAELTRAAETHQQTATTQLDYANKLVAARQADVETARLHVATVEAGGGAAASTSKQSDQRLVDAQDAENAARQRASERGRAALAAQRAWEDASGRARAAVSPVEAAPMGTGSGGGATDPGAPVPTPLPSDPAPAGH